MKKNRIESNRNTNIKDKYIWILLILLVIVFVIIGININSKYIMKFDNFIYSNISKLMSTFVTNTMKIITNLGSVWGLSIICILLMVLIKDKRYGLYAFLDIFGVGFLNLIIKVIFARPRPQIFPIIKETGYSFPSGHSMASMAFYGFLIYFTYKKIKNKKIRNLIISSLSLLILLVGISRIYLGVHYPSDVLCGYILSIVYLICYIKFIEMEEINGTNK